MINPFHSDAFPFKWAIFARFSQSLSIRAHGT
jgi:hypothetical protein